MLYIEGGKKKAQTISCLSLLGFMRANRELTLLCGFSRFRRGFDSFGSRFGLFLSGIARALGLDGFGDLIKHFGQHVRSRVRNLFDSGDQSLRHVASG